MSRQITLGLIFVVPVVALCSFVALFRVPSATAHPPLDATPIGEDYYNPKYLNKNSCPDDPKNLIVNGGFFPDLHDTPYGSVANGWEPFIYNGIPPQFRWVNNEGIFRSQSEQIFSSAKFDAGIMQTVHNVQPGTFYWFRLGWVPAVKSYDGPNVGVPSVGAKVGVDPFGGTDPRSPNVIWGQDLWGDPKGLNRPQMILLFPARSSNVTLFMRGMATDDTSGENRVWFNAVCMEARPEIPPAALLPPTLAPVPPMATGSPTLKPTVKPNTPLPSSTKAPTRAPTATATATTAVVAISAKPPEPPKTAEAAIMPQPTMIFARPVVAKAANVIPADPGLFAGLGFGSIFGSVVMFGFGLVLVRKRG